MKKALYLFLTFCTALFIWIACADIPEPEPEPQPDPKEQEELTAKKYLKNEYMDVYYYWYKEMPQNVSTVFSIEKYFKALLVKKDRWSWMTDAKSYLNSESGIVTGTFGASIAQPVEFYNDYNIKVRYVYPNSPFANRGITRGWTLTHIAGTPVMTLIKAGTFNQKYYTSPQTFTFIDLDGKSHTFENVVAAQTLNTRPSLIKKIFDAEDYPGLSSPVGYLLYMGFEAGNDITGKSMLDDITEPLAQFKAAGCKNIILDLRYNGGGSATASNLLVSLLAPSSANGKIYVQRNHNDKLAQYDQVSEVKRTDNSLELDNLYIITGAGSASASEMVLNGLKPLMNLHHVGDTTYGKPNGMYVLFYPGTNADYDRYDKGDYSKLKYVFLPIAFYNKNGIGNEIPDTGMIPDYYIADDLYHDFDTSEKNIDACLYHIVNGKYPNAEPKVQTMDKNGLQIPLAEEERNPHYGLMTVKLR